MAKTYSKTELDEMMAEATAAVELLVKSEVASLQKKESSSSEASASAVAKTDSVQTAEDKKAQGGQMSKAGADPSSPPEASASGSPAPDAGGPPADALAPAASPSPDPAASASADPAAAAGGRASMEELVSAYGQLSPDELALHMQALQQVMAAAQATAAPQAGAPPMGAPAPAASAASPASGPDATAPLPADQSQGVNPEFAMKAEKLQTQVDELQKSLSLAVDALTIVMSQPKVKSITGDDVVLKSEPNISLASLSKSQVNERLNKAIRSGKLEKSDGDLIKGYFNGQKQVADIAHLLK